MTDVSNLDDLARKIAASSPNIRNYAVAQAAATQSQETELRDLAVRVAALEETDPPPPPPPPPPSGWPAAPVGPFTVTTQSPTFLRETGNLTTEKIHLNADPAGEAEPYGIANMVWPPQPSTGVWTLRDCISENVHAPVPRSRDGTAESGFWIGQRTNASRLVARNAAWMGMFTGAMCDGSVIEDVLMENNPHVGIYLEHVTRNTTFRRIKIDHRGADANAFNVEWWYQSGVYGPMLPYGGKAGSYSCLIEDFDITVDAGCWAFYLDAGTFDFTIRNGVIRGTGNGIKHPSRLVDPAKPNKIDWETIRFEATGTREQIHSDPIG